MSHPARHTIDRFALLCACLTVPAWGAAAQVGPPLIASAALPDAPSATLALATRTEDSATEAPGVLDPSRSSTEGSSSEDDLGWMQVAGAQTSSQIPAPADSAATTVGQQPKRILGLMPNYRSVSRGVTPPPPTLRQNFKVATRQALDYSSFIFLTITSASAYWQDSHPSLNTNNGGNAIFWAYLWRGFLDKTDQTYQSAFILPTLLHEDTRYYALGEGSKWKRLAYASTRVAVARTYSGHNTPNLAGLGGKAGAQAVSTLYYPSTATTFGVLATKFAYSVARDIGFTVFREFYPDIATHVLHRKP